FQSEAHADFFVSTTPQLEGDVLVLDFTEINQWSIGDDPALALRLYDLLHTAACLQGIVNRDSPRLLVRAVPEDDGWLNYLRDDGGWLQRARINPISNSRGPESALLEAIVHFKSLIAGVVEWDPNVAATSNVATTIAGMEDLLPIRGGSDSNSLAASLLAIGLPLRHSLVGKFIGCGTIPDIGIASSGSTKCDAYLWAKSLYLDSGKCNPGRLGYWLDSFWLSNPGRLSWWECCLTNHDWIVKHRGFLFDLSNWDDEAPQDDPGQPLGTDVETFNAIMRSAAERAGNTMIHVAGFTPWAHKYTEISEPPGKHGAVHTEWEVVRILSAFNAYLDADAIGISALVNASFWSHFPLADRYVQNPSPTLSELQGKGYIDPDGSLAPLGFTMFYIGDYDSAAWLYRREQELWQDPVRGAVPMGWAYNPNLSERFPVGLHYAFDKASRNDFFTAGDSGAGYVNPTMLIEPRPISGLPSCEDVWVTHCREFYQRFNYRITGFLINGHAGLLTNESERMTARFSPEGAVTQPHWMKVSQHLTDNMPVAMQLGDLDWDEKQSAEFMAPYRTPGETQFLNFRTIMRSPGFIQGVSEEAQALRRDAPFAMLDPSSFFSLLRRHLGGEDTRRCTFAFDTLPKSVGAGTLVEGDVGIRNDGWDIWQKGEAQLCVRLSIDDQLVETTLVDLPHCVEPGQGAVVGLSLTAPGMAGSYDLRYELIRCDDSGQNCVSNAWYSSLKVH
ncbi:MAG: hypothetical protein WCL39_12560, partial [Armatimonadota bacterium]